MAGSEPRPGGVSPGPGGVSPQPHHSDWGRLEAAFLSSWRSFWQSVGKERTAPRAPQEEAAAEADTETSALTRLPVSGGCRPLSAEGPGRVGLVVGATSRDLGASQRPCLGLASSLQPFRAMASPGSHC